MFNQFKGESTGKRTSYELARILSKSRYEPRLRATPRKRVVYEPRALSSEGATCDLGYFSVERFSQTQAGRKVKEITH